MTTDAEEETKPPENARNSMDWMAQLVERWTSYPKVVGSNPTPVEVFGFRLLTSPGVIHTYEKKVISVFILEG